MQRRKLWIVLVHLCVVMDVSDKCRQNVKCHKFVRSRNQKPLMGDGRPRNFRSYTDIAVSRAGGETSLIIQLYVFLRVTEVGVEDMIDKIIVTETHGVAGQ